MVDLFVVESHKLARRKLPRNTTSLRMTKFIRKSDFILLQIYYLRTVKRTDLAEVDENLWFSANRSLTLKDSWMLKLQKYKAKNLNKIYKFIL